MDIELFRFINLGWRNPVCDVLFSFLSYSGLGITAALVAIALAYSKGKRPIGLAIGLGALIGGTVLGQTAKHLILLARLVSPLLREFFYLANVNGSQ
jgi:hypothetical protein